MIRGSHGTSLLEVRGGVPRLRHQPANAPPPERLVIGGACGTCLLAPLAMCGDPWTASQLSDA